MPTFQTGYIDEALDHLDMYVDMACNELKEIDFDTIVGTGFSGSIVIPTIALRLDKKFVLIRKETDDSHHGPGKLVGNLGKRWVFVDDVVSSGSTKNRVLRKIEGAHTRWGEPIESTYVGDYMYAVTLGERFKEARKASYGYMFTNPHTNEVEI